MAVQTSYLQKAAALFAGQLADVGKRDIFAYRNDETVDVPVGLAVMQNSASDSGFKLPNALGVMLIGVVINSMFRTPGFPGAGSEGNALGIIPGDMANIAREGRVGVLVEEAVTPASPVFVRVAVSANTPSLNQLGSFRASPDGVAQVTTVTPTAAPSTVYVQRIEVPSITPGVPSKTFEFEVESAASAETATTIGNALRAEMAADAEFTALVTASGTATLILTGVTPGQSFTVTSEGDGVLAVVNTTPAAATAILWKGQSYLTSAASGAVSRLDINVPAGRI